MAEQSPRSLYAKKGWCENYGAHRIEEGVAFCTTASTPTFHARHGNVHAHTLSSFLLLPAEADGTVYVILLTYEFFYGVREQGFQKLQGRSFSGSIEPISKLQKASGS